MMQKGLLLLLAIFAFAFASVSAQLILNDPCEELSCSDCTNGGKKSKCRWFVRKGEEGRCIGKERCHDKGFEGGKCKKKCKKPNCKPCLEKGWGWIPAANQCAEVCTMIADTSCVFLEKGESAKKVCKVLKIEEKNKKRCMEAGQKGGCELCSQTFPMTPPGAITIMESCHWYPDAGVCSTNNADPNLGQGSAGCPDPPIGIDPVIPEPPTEWPELVGENAKIAAKTIEDSYGTGVLDIVLVKAGSHVTSDYKEDRVRIYYDPKTNLVTDDPHYPKIG